MFLLKLYFFLSFEVARKLHYLRLNTSTHLLQSMLGVAVLAALAVLQFLGVIDDADFLIKTKQTKACQNIEHGTRWSSRC